MCWPHWNMQFYRDETGTRQVMEVNRKTPGKYLKGIKECSSRKVTQLTAQLRCLYTKARGMDNKQEEWEATMLLESYGHEQVKSLWLQEESQSQGLVLPGDFNHPDICGGSSSVSCRRSRRLLECMQDNFLSQIIDSPTRGDAILDLMVTNISKLFGDMKTGGSLGCSDHAPVEFTVLRDKGQQCTAGLHLDKMNLIITDPIRLIWLVVEVPRGTKSSANPIRALDADTSLARDLGGAGIPNESAFQAWEIQSQSYPELHQKKRGHQIIFSEDEGFPKNPDDVQCTSGMWLRFARLGPEMYSRYLATLQWRESEDKVGVLANKLRIYEDTVTAPFRTHVSSVETRLAEQVQSLIEEGHQKLKKELKEEIYHISPEPTRVSAIRSRRPPARERGYTPRGNLWSFLQEHGEDMKK
ncbi:hypothetical protein HGM15179_015625 [Zosterops borbonicus]|uniref:Uncharacterized protein n=1 Tax=Zosterops borbonicus TaxID=364589 RepID=A0A8K1LF59_9PASS|nr:hypothetical protein HGM15179_015625 [Zosterops borbonicus]